MEVGRTGKAHEDEDDALEVCPAAVSSSEWESKKLVIGAWKRRRLVIDSMVRWMGIGEVEGAREGGCRVWSRSLMPRVGDIDRASIELSRKEGEKGIGLDEWWMRLGSCGKKMRNRDMS